MKAFISMIAAMKMVTLFEEEMCFGKSQNESTGFSSNNEELERIERNIRMVKQEIHVV